MRSVDSGFYHSSQWKNLRKAYKDEHPVCEICLKRGKISPTEHIHHKIWLNESNVFDPSVSLNKDNLLAVCKECHNKIHAGTINRRYEVGTNGEIISVEPIDFLSQSPLF